MRSQHDRPPYALGDIVGQKYRVQEILGEGGMAIVYEAVDTTCGRRVAIKVIRPSHASLGHYSSERMRREAEVLVHLHERTESVVDVLTAGITDDGHHLPYYVMERLCGGTLRQFLSDQRARGVDFTLDEVTGIAIPIAMALSHAHALGIVHRDTKPENVFMTVMRDEGVVVKMLDFGICATESDGESKTFAGTLPYAAPEQLEGKKPLPATDVYALGLVIFELLTLKLPHGRHRDDLTLPRLALAVVKEPVPDLAAIRGGVPPRFVKLVTSCLSTDPAQRPSAHDVAKTLRDIKLAPLEHSEPVQVFPSSWSGRLGENQFVRALIAEHRERFDEEVGRETPTRLRMQRRESLVGTASTAPPHVPRRRGTTLLVAMAAAGLAVGVLGAAGYRTYGEPRPHAAVAALGTTAPAPETPREPDVGADAAPGFSPERVVIVEPVVPAASAPASASSARPAPARAKAARLAPPVSSAARNLEGFHTTLDLPSPPPRAPGAARAGDGR